jgi:FtsZ-binding cell division protein ZapB
MKERINAFWNKHFGASLFSEDGKETKLSEEHVSKLEGLDKELDDLRAQNATLKDEAQTAATTISDLEAAAETAKTEKEATQTSIDAVASTLANYNVKVEEGKDVLAVANETLEAWAKRSGLATAVPVSTADNLEDGNKDSFYSQTDEDVKAARAALNL